MASYLEGLADSSIQRVPLCFSIDLDRTDEEILLFDILDNGRTKQSFTIFYRPNRKHVL